MDAREQEQWLAERFANEQAEPLATESDLSDRWLNGASIDDYLPGQQLTAPQLHELGFTAAAIDRHLSPEPDTSDADDDIERIQYAPNNDYRTPTRYYSVEEVKRAMQTPELKAWLERTKQRRAKLNAPGQEQIRLALGATIGMLEDPTRTDTAARRHINIPLYRLLRKSVTAYNNTHWRTIKAGSLPALDLDSDDPAMMHTINTVCVRYIRDEHTGFPSVWNAFKTKQCAEETGTILRIKTALVIGRAYPQLQKAINHVFFQPAGFDNPKP